MTTSVTTTSVMTTSVTEFSPMGLLPICSPGADPVPSRGWGCPSCNLCRPAASAVQGLTLTFGRSAIERCVWCPPCVVSAVCVVSAIERAVRRREIASAAARRGSGTFQRESAAARRPQAVCTRRRRSKAGILQMCFRMSHVALPRALHGHGPLTAWSARSLPRSKHTYQIRDIFGKYTSRRLNYLRKRAEQLLCARPSSKYTCLGAATR
jgi:hypothetical protein